MIRLSIIAEGIIYADGEVSQKVVPLYFSCPFLGEWKLKLVVQNEKKGYH